MQSNERTEDDVDDRLDRVRTHSQKAIFHELLAISFNITLRQRWNVLN